MLLPDDERYLKDKGLEFDFLETGSTGLLIIKDYLLPSGFSHNRVELLLEVPGGYPDAGMDMFWVRPPIKIAATNAWPRAAEVMQTKSGDGGEWQRFSRHGYPWKPGDSVASYLIWVRRSFEDDVGTPQ